MIVIIYDNSAIEPYKNRGLGQHENVGEKPTVILYNCSIDNHTGTPNNTKTKDTIIFDHSSLSYIACRIGWVSMKGIYKL